MSSRTLRTPLLAWFAVLALVTLAAAGLTLADVSAVRSRARVDPGDRPEGNAAAPILPTLETRWQDYLKSQGSLMAASLLAPRAEALPRHDAIARLNELVNVVTSNAYGELAGT